MTTKPWVKKKPIPRCFLCGGAKGNIEPQVIDKYEFLAHPACRKRLDDDFIVYFIEATSAMKQGEKRP